jgi:hypothetical protein
MQRLLCAVFQNKPIHPLAWVDALQNGKNSERLIFSKQ